MNKDTCIFVVGNPRSGTTMVSRMLGNHTAIHSFRELHFFEALWASEDRGRTLAFDEAVRFAEKLYCISEEGFLFHKNPGKYSPQARAIVSELKVKGPTVIDVYAAFLKKVALQHGKAIPCEQTPLYVYYLDEIFSYFPNARVINMVRDPRDVLLSQKYRWRRAYRESHRYLFMRLWMNYHPISTSWMWRSAVRTVRRLGDGRIHTVRFEDLLENPGPEVRRIAEFVGVPYSEDMLEIPIVNSSIHPDRPKQKGVDKTRTGNWRRGGINASEIYILQKIATAEMKDFGYECVRVRPNPLALIYYLITFGIKLPLSMFMHRANFRNLKEAIKMRLLVGKSRGMASRVRKGMDES